jgi:tRNA(fMet)-specific endonuclease VapC
LKKYLLDTNICIYFLKGKYGLNEKIVAIGQENCFISEVTVAEMKYGIENQCRLVKHFLNPEGVKLL